MSTPAFPTPRSSAPADTPVPLHGPDFAIDPGAVYERLRQEQGPVARVELGPGVPATLVVDYLTAREVLNNPSIYRKDSRRWQERAPADASVVPMMSWRPNCLYADGAEHDRLRTAVTDSVGRIDTHALRRSVARHADRLINEFGPTGQADLLGQYAAQLPLLAIVELFGCPPELGVELAGHVRAVFDGIDAARRNAALSQCLQVLIETKRQDRGADVTSWLMDHPAALTDEELLHQLVVLMGAGVDPTQNWICNALRLLRSDQRFSGDLTGGGLSIGDALHEVLLADPPMANYAIHYPIRDVSLEGVLLRRDEPVVISFAAINRQLAKEADETGTRAHVAFSAGPHECPAQDVAFVIASVAIEKLVSRLPDLRLAVPAEELAWRPGSFQRGLQALPVLFSPVEPVFTEGVRPCETPPPPMPSMSREPMSTVKESSSERGGLRRVWSSLVAWWHGQ